MQRTMEVGVDMPVKWMVEDWNGGMLEYGNAGIRECWSEGVTCGTLVKVRKQGSGCQGSGGNIP